jgi:hypothetical protein
MIVPTFTLTFTLICSMTEKAQYYLEVKCLSKQWQLLYDGELAWCRYEALTESQNLSLGYVPVKKKGSESI